MILPGSYANGFAPRDGQPLYPELWRGCVGAWAPCLGPTGLTLRDWSGYGNHGTLTNMDAGSDWVANGGKYALDFDGTDDYISIAKPNWTGGAKTIFAWIRLATLGRNNWIFDGSTDPSFGYSPMFRVHLTNKLRFWNYQATFFVDSVTSISANEWTAVAASWDRTTSSVWINGNKDASSTGDSSTDAGANWRIASSSFFSQFCAGQISELRFYNRAISATDHKILSTRRGIAYEMAPRRRSSAQVTVAPLRYNLFSGSIGNTDVIGAS